MQVKLSQPLSFIREKNLLSFFIEHRNGANIIVSGSFSQNVKKSELDQIMAHNLLKNEAPVQAVKKTSKELMAEAKALKAQEEADAKEKEGQETEPKQGEKL